MAWLDGQPMVRLRSMGLMFFIISVHENLNNSIQLILNLKFLKPIFLIFSTRKFIHVFFTFIFHLFPP